MDLMTYSSVTEEDYITLTISVLRQATKDQLSCMLNSNKILPSPENLPRDWRGLCTLLEYTIPSGCQLNDPMSKIFKFCDKTTIAYFIQCLEHIDRYDVIEDTKKFITSDINFFKTQKYTLANPTPLLQNNSDIDIITDDDLYASINGLPLPRYDAFLLFDDTDTKSAEVIVDKLENDFKYKLLLKDRNLRPGVAFESQAIIRLISNRCNWVIIIVSNDFLKSSANRFIMNYIQSLAIEQSICKIIPCVFNDYAIPEEFRFHVKLFFNKVNPFCDPWNKLQKAIAPNNYQALTNSENTSVSNQKLSTEKHKVEQSKSEFSKEINVEIINNYNGQTLTNNKQKITPENTSIKQNEQEHTIDQENNTISKSKNVLNRLVESVVPKKWSKKMKKKRKVNCTNP